MAQPVPSAVMVVGGEQSMATSNGPLAPKSVTAGKVMAQDAAPSAEPFEASREGCDEASSEVEGVPASSPAEAASPEGPTEPDPSGGAASSSGVGRVEPSSLTAGGASLP